VPADAGITSRLFPVALGPARLHSAFGMRTFLPVACAVLLVSCGRVPDPPFISQSGDLGAFLVEAISKRAPSLEVSNSRPSIQTSWRSRVLTDRHRSGEYLAGREALQVVTATTNFTRVESLLTRRLGAPKLPLRQETGDWRHVGWSRPDQGLGVWLVEDKNQCSVEVVTHKVKGKS
jgi:hypothetical protein